VCIIALHSRDSISPNHQIGSSAHWREPRMSHFESRHDFSENIGASRRISWRPAVGNASFKRQRPNASRLGRCIGTHVARCSFFFLDCVAAAWFSFVLSSAGPTISGRCFPTIALAAVCTCRLHCCLVPEITARVSALARGDIGRTDMEWRRDDFSAG